MSDHSTPSQSRACSLHFWANGKPKTSPKIIWQCPLTLQTLHNTEISRNMTQNSDISAEPPQKCLLLYPNILQRPDGTFNGALGDIISKKADFIVNGCFVKDYETRLLEFTTAINDDKLCIVVQTASLVINKFVDYRYLGFLRDTWDI